MTPSTPTRMTRTIATRTICTCEHSSAPLVVFHVSLMMCHTTLAQVVQVSLPFYFDLSFPVFFHSSVLTHPDLHTDLDNVDSVENNLRHSAKGSLDAYDVTLSLTFRRMRVHYSLPCFRRARCFDVTLARTFSPGSLEHKQHRPLSLSSACYALMFFFITTNDHAQAKKKKTQSSVPCTRPDGKRVSLRSCF